MESPNKRILDEVKDWFHAKKTRPIWAKRFESDQTVETLEGVESVKAGDYLCRGEAGDVWPQSSESLKSKYAPVGEPDDEGWRKYDPRPDAEGVLAARVDHPFTVEATWGTLTGKPGDVIVKNFRDRDVDYPRDVWIVDRALFEATYEPVRN